MRKIATLAGVVSLTAAMLVVVLAGSSGADTFNVASEADYRAALVSAGASATGPHTLNITADFSVNAAGGDPTYNNGVAADQNLIINGNGHTVSAAVAGVRFLFFNPTTTSLTVNDLTVQGFDTGDGAAIQSFGDVFLNRCTFRNNHSSGNGGAIDLPASVNDIAVNDCTFDNNVAEDDQGGAINGGEGITVTNSTFVRNLAMFSSAEGGALYSDSGPVTVTNSTFTSNTSEGTPTDGGAAISNPSGTTTLSYVTLSGNTSPADTLSLDDATMFGVVIVNTLGGGVNCTINGTLTSLGYNYSSDASCAFAGTGDTNSGAANPGLGALASNGGPTQTMLPATGSPLIDKIPSASPCAGINIPEDQRHLPRPSDGNNDGVLACDIGAVEVQAIPAVAVVPRFTG